MLCLLLATPAVLAGPDPAPAAVLSLLLLALASLMFGLGNRQIRVLIRHPLLAMVDIALTLGPAAERGLRRNRRRSRWSAPPC